MTVSAPGSIAELELGVDADVVAVDLRPGTGAATPSSVGRERADPGLGHVVEVVDLAVAGGAQPLGQHAGDDRAHVALCGPAQDSDRQRPVVDLDPLADSHRAVAEVGERVGVLGQDGDALAGATARLEAHPHRVAQVVAVERADGDPGVEVRPGLAPSASVCDRRASRPWRRGPSRRRTRSGGRWRSRGRSGAARSGRRGRAGARSRRRRRSGSRACGRRRWSSRRAGSRPARRCPRGRWRPRSGCRRRRRRRRCRSRRRSPRARSRSRGSAPRSRPPRPRSGPGARRRPGS